MRFVFKPLLLVVTAFNVFLFVSLFGNRGEGRPMLSAYLAQDSSSYKLSDLVLLQRVVGQVDRDYVDPDRVKPEVMLQKALERIQRDIPELMFDLSPDEKELAVTVGSVEKTFNVPPVNSLADLVSTLKVSLTFVEQHLHTDVPMQDVEYAAINGILSTLDPHSILLPPEMAREMDVQIQGEFGGLGITISLRGDDNILTVINTLPDTPAARAGLRAGDQILQIEDESTINMSLNEAVSKLRGPVGSPVNILVNRQAWGQPKSFNVRRETIKIDSIVADYLGQGVGYVHIKTFQHNTSKDLITALDNFRAENGPLKGLVLDLRNNPGGPLQQAIEVSDRFLESGTIVMTVQADNRDTEDYKAIVKGTEDEYPIVVIVDAESASASEIVAGALKNQDRAVIIGDHTFGKGSVQNLYSYPDDSKLKLTMAKYLTPGRKSIQSVGITPDLRLIPVFFNKKATYFYSTGHIFREKDLDSHFEQTDDGKGDRSVDTIRYFSPKEFEAYRIGEEEGEEDKPRDDLAEPKKEDPKADFQVQFARDLILKAGRPTRSATVTAARSFLKSVKELKEDEIQKQFSSLGIDWSEGRSGAATLATQVKLGDGSGPLMAGKTVPVQVTVTNTGKTPAYQVRALTDCELGSFKDLEFLFGRIDPGASRTYTRDVKVPGNLFSLAEPMTLKVFESAESPAGESQVMVKVDEQPHPVFAYNLVVVDDGSGSSHGNGDGRIQRGEDIDLVVMMKNIGQGDASKAIAKIQNNSGKYVYLKSGTANLKEVPAGRWLEGRFHFQVKDGFEDKAIEFDMISGDANFLRRPKDDVELPVDLAPPVQVQTVSALFRVKGSSSLVIRGGAEDASPAFAQVPAGSVLKANGKLPGWIRIEVPWTEGAMSGWVPETAVEAGGTAPSTVATFTPLFSKVPPTVTMPIASRDLPNSTRELELKGQIRDDEAVTSMYVFVNNQKRYLHTISPDELKPAPGGGVVASFATRVPLEEGTNTIEVYARDNEKIQSLDIFQVYRSKQVGQQAVNDNGRKVDAAQR